MKLTVWKSSDIPRLARLVLILSISWTLADGLHEHINFWRMLFLKRRLAVDRIRRGVEALTIERVSNETPSFAILHTSGCRSLAHSVVDGGIDLLIDLLQHLQRDILRDRDH